MFENEDHKAPFIIPFLVAMALGIPVSILWYLIAMKVGVVATVVTILLGCACGFGARLPASGWHPAKAAILSTFLLIVLSISAITITLIASETEQSILATTLGLIAKGSYVDLANAIVHVAGKTFMGYPLGLYAAYRISDAS